MQPPCELQIWAFTQPAQVIAEIDRLTEANNNTSQVYAGFSDSMPLSELAQPPEAPDFTLRKQVLDKKASKAPPKKQLLMLGGATASSSSSTAVTKKKKCPFGSA